MAGGSDEFVERSSQGYLPRSNLNGAVYEILLTEQLKGFISRF
jgi:hypothetical protein